MYIPNLVDIFFSASTICFLVTLYIILPAFELPAIFPLKKKLVLK